HPHHGDVALRTGVVVRGNHAYALPCAVASICRAAQLWFWSDQTTATASAAQISFDTPNNGPFDALRPTAFSFVGPKRSIRAWRMLPSLARESWHRCIFTASRFNRCQGRP